MGAYRSTYVAYGVRIDSTDWELQEWQANGVSIMAAGAYGGDGEMFLVITDTWENLKPGQTWYVKPYAATDERYPEWDWKLVHAAEELRVKILTEPAWIFAPDES